MRCIVLWLLCLAAGLSGCSSLHYEINPPLRAVKADEGYRLQRFIDTDPDDHLFMQVAVSGGGARAATLGFGVLEEMRDTRVRWEGREERLIDELDVLMGVSGGSMLTAAVALDGVDGLPQFEKEFLNASLQQDFKARLFRPSNLWRLTSPSYGRSDALERFLDERLYRGATFGDLAKVPRKPFAVIYATDMVTGGRFEFVQDQFDFLCSDLDGVKLARAVAASSAVPLVLSPITLWNHASDVSNTDCGSPVVRQVSERLGAQFGSRRLTELEGYRERARGQLRRPYIHLIDGGLADNVNARGAADYIAQFGGLANGARFAGYRGMRRMVFIVVNAETSTRSPEDMSPMVPGPLRTALALADIPINRNSSAALTQMRATVDVWRDEVQFAHARGDFSVFAQDIRFYVIEVNLTAPDNAELSERLQSIPTTLQLTGEEVAQLRSHARAQLRASTEYQRLLRDLN